MFISIMLQYTCPRWAAARPVMCLLAAGRMGGGASAGRDYRAADMIAPETLDDEKKYVF